LREAAAVRLQAHLLGAWGLRGLLHPTTEVKRLFFSLADDALAPADDPAVAPAKLAAMRAGGMPFREALRAALSATALLEAAPRSCAATRRWWWSAAGASRWRAAATVAPRSTAPTAARIAARCTATGRAPAATSPPAGVTAWTRDARWV